eukprot:6368976-Ditylum_brightwellii.AAC.1
MGYFVATIAIVSLFLGNNESAKTFVGAFSSSAVPPPSRKSQQSSSTLHNSLQPIAFVINRDNDHVMKRNSHVPTFHSTSGCHNSQSTITTALSMNSAAADTETYENADGDWSDVEQYADILENLTEEPSASTLRSVTFKSLTSSTPPEILSEFLLELGACSVSITDHDRDTPNETPIFREPGNNKEDWATIICGDAAVESIRVAFELDVALRFEVDNVPDLDW